MSSPPPIPHPPSLDALAVPHTTILADNPHLSNLCVGALIFHPSPSSLTTSTLSSSPSTTTTAPTAAPRLLLLRRAATEPAFPNLWEVPGGGCEPDDATLLHTVVREVQEEAGLTVTAVTGVVAGWDEFRGRVGRAWRKYTFFVQVAQGDGEGGEYGGELRVVTDPVEHGAWMWACLEDLEGLEMTSVVQRGHVEAALKGVQVGRAAEN
ncbi:NUDIX hydrolase domain-like protein [Geopyxis carbonaria]|nr:NUDIX hydrolase domain-like protein [Geopyxis carbonaria]